MPNTDPQNEYEALHNSALRETERRIRRYFESAILELAPIAATITAADGTIFQLANYPALNNRINRLIQRLHASIYATTINGINLGWDLSNEKNDLIVDRRLAGKKPTEKAGQILYDPNDGARKSFATRQEKGLNLSDRVWKGIQGYRTEMEAQIGLGISEGRSANAMAAELRSHLDEPERLFRRVRDHEGRLRLSNAAKNYHPGQGVARSSFANAKRLARTEQNAAYHLADQERWKNLPFVKGYEIKLSNNHPFFDICDELKGIYPVTFVWHSWHPNCRCHCVAVQISDAEYDKYEDSILGLGEAPEIQRIEAPPAKFGQYVEKNRERIEGWANRPYWHLHNPSFIGEIRNK
jgi:hypothetical protein